MSDVGGILFIIGIVGIIPTLGKAAHTYFKERDLNPIDVVLVFIFFILIIAGANN